ncbi:hypothetical protein Ae201684_013894 [Aphanomyces euteiches]|uniref:DUF8040 domain-containing protein n=1 Tax=Aphanomyces euteiches TaxID=100861 RepID=A0A6G0WLS9_9STRA|nr:hypothetical protein Ae201684_013894 [Aphanomyces euteiches]
MLPNTFLSLLEMLQSKYSLKSSRYVTAREKLAIFLFVVGNAASNRAAQERFQRSGCTITESIHDVGDPIAFASLPRCRDPFEQRYTL